MDKDALDQGTSERENSILEIKGRSKELEYQARLWFKQNELAKMHA